MYHNSICCRTVRPLRFRGRCPTVQGNKCDGGLGGRLSFDPTNTHALLCAVNALPSTKAPRRCRVETSCPDNSPPQSSPCSASTSSTSSDATHGRLPSCPSNAGSPPHSSIVEDGTVQTGSSNSTSLENSSRGMSHRGKGSLQVVQAGAGSSSRDSEKLNGLTWIDWGWPGTHTPCPFNPRHTVDDVLIRPERVGVVITQNVPEAHTQEDFYVHFSCNIQVILR